MSVATGFRWIFFIILFTVSKINIFCFLWFHTTCVFVCCALEVNKKNDDDDDDDEEGSSVMKFYSRNKIMYAKQKQKNKKKIVKLHYNLKLI